MKKEVNTFAEYMADKDRVSDTEREQINFQVELIGRMVEALEGDRLAKLSSAGHTDLDIP